MTKKNGLLGEIWVYVGMRKCGKTTCMIKDTRKVPINRLFVNEFHGSPWKDAGRNNRKWMQRDDFIELCCKAQDALFVFEDATALFRGGTTMRFNEAMARSREEGVTIFLPFHSFRKIPDDILDMIDGVVIFKTRDKEHRVIDKCEDPRVVEAWKQVCADPDPHAKKRIKFTVH